MQITQKVRSNLLEREKILLKKQLENSLTFREEYELITLTKRLDRD